MNRELNPQLFGTASTQIEKLGAPVDPNRPAAPIMGRNNEQARAVPYPPIDVKALEHQISTLKVALIQMEKRTDSIGSRMEELARSVHSRLERFSNAIVRAEESQSAHQQDSSAKFAQIVAKVNERRLHENKVQELIDRHNTIIRNFENRLVSLQRLVSEQELALHNAQAALEDARTELIKANRR